MYIFRINNLIDKSKAALVGETIDFTAFTTTAQRHLYAPPIWTSGTTANDIGDVYALKGYVYSNLVKSNTSNPEFNYAGFPGNEDLINKKGLSSWIRTEYDNYIAMLLPESGAITESFNSDMTVTINKGINTANVNACTSLLVTGVLGSEITINSQTKTQLDVKEGEPNIGDPEISGMAKAFSMTGNADASYSVMIKKSIPAVSSYCSGLYLGSWSYLGITQTTDHKKQVTDYSNVQQADTGDYSLAKRRTGRTYNAEVLLTPRKNAVAGDYDHNMIDLCNSVNSFLQSQFGKINGFYFGNVDIGAPHIPHCTDKKGEIVELNDSDILVGVLKTFDISEIGNDVAILKMSVDSVPSEYKFYTTESVSNAPIVYGMVACTSIVMYGSDISWYIGSDILSNLYTKEPSNGSVGLPIVSSNDTTICTISSDNSGVILTGLKAGTTFINIRLPYWLANTIVYADVTRKVIVE